MGCRLIICCWGMNSTSICILYYYDTYVQKEDDVSLLCYISILNPSTFL